MFIREDISPLYFMHYLLMMLMICIDGFIRLGNDFYDALLQADNKVLDFNIVFDR